LLFGFWFLVFGFLLRGQARFDFFGVALPCGLFWCFGLCAGIRDLLARFRRRRSVFWFFRWHPRIVISLQASPLCGAAPTFLCRRKEK
jgi:hypothetical protein